MFKVPKNMAQTYRNPLTETTCFPSCSNEGSCICCCLCTFRTGSFSRFPGPPGTVEWTTSESA